MVHSNDCIPVAEQTTAKKSSLFLYNESKQTANIIMEMVEISNQIANLNPTYAQIRNNCKDHEVKYILDCPMLMTMQKVAIKCRFHGYPFLLADLGDPEKMPSGLRCK